MLNHYLARAKALHAQECALHDSLDEQIKPVMASKRLLLFKEMMDDAGVQDKELFSDMCNGFRLVGDLQPSGQFQQQWKPAALGVEQLQQTALWAQKAVVSSCQGQRDSRGSLGRNDGAGCRWQAMGPWTVHCRAGHKTTRASLDTCKTLRGQTRRQGETCGRLLTVPHQRCSDLSWEDWLGGDWPHMFNS